MKLTQPAIAKLTLPAGKADAIFFDDDVAGLGLRLRGGGKRSWIFQYQLGKKQRRMSLGLAAAVTLAQARKTAGELHARVRLGEDPAASRAEGRIRAADTFEATLRIYLPEKKRVMRPKSYTSVERHLLRYAKPLHGLGLALVTRRDVASLLAGVAAASGSVSANRTRASLSGFFTWAMQRGLTEAANPVAGTHVAPEQARSRVLTIEELAAVWRHAGDDSFGKAIRLLILTACRAAEIGGLLWGEIRDGMIVLPAERVKTGRPHVVPIPGPAQSILSTIARDRYGDHVFARGGFRSWSYGKRQLDARLAAAALRVELWTIHDLRRSAATHMGELGVSPHVIEAVLNHAGHRAGVGGIYNRSGYEREKRAALDMWADHVIAALDGEESKVVSLHA